MSVDYGVADPRWENLLPNKKRKTKREATKREAAPEKETNNMTLNELQYQVECAEAAFDDGRIGEADAQLRKLEKRLKHRVTVSSVDDGQDDNNQQLADLRGAADDEDESNDASDDDVDDDESNGDQQEDPDEDDDDEDEPVRKSSPYGHTGVNEGRSGMYPGLGDNTGVYPDTQTRTPSVPKFLVRADNIRLRDGVSRNVAMQTAKKEHPQDFESFQRWKDKSSVAKAAAGFDPLAPRGRSSTHPSTQSYTTSPATGMPKKSSFDDIVDAIVRRDNCTRTTALQRARAEHPTEYSTYQGFLSSSKTNDQQSRRSTTDAVFKSAPCLEQLVAQEMGLGCNETVAKQRLWHRYGNNLPPSAIVTKSASLTEQFNDAVADVVAECDCSLTEASEYVARTNPVLMKYLR